MGCGAGAFLREDAAPGECVHESYVSGCDWLSTAWTWASGHLWAPFGGALTPAGPGWGEGLLVSLRGAASPLELRTTLGVKRQGIAHSVSCVLGAGGGLAVVRLYLTIVS